MSLALPSTEMLWESPEGGCLHRCGALSRRWLPGYINWEAKWLHGFWKLLWLLDVCLCLEVESSSVDMVLEHQEHWLSPWSSHLHVGPSISSPIATSTISPDGHKSSFPKVSQCGHQGTKRLTSEHKALFCWILCLTYRSTQSRSQDLDLVLSRLQLTVDLWSHCVC